MAPPYETDIPHTRLSVTAAKYYYLALVDLVTSVNPIPISYKKLNDEAIRRASVSDKQELRRIIPLKVGNHLLLMREFTKDISYPDLSCWVVNQKTQRPGLSYLDAYPNFTQDQIETLDQKYDWKNTLSSFHNFILDMENSAYK